MVALEGLEEEGWAEGGEAVVGRAVAEKEAAVGAVMTCVGNKRTIAWMDGCMDGWMHGWMDGWMDGWKDGHIKLMSPIL
jgi:hypothetical protein